MSRPQAVQQPEQARTSQRPEAQAPAATPAGALPIPTHLSELKSHHVTQLVEMAVSNGIENASRMRKQDLIFAL
ncbi:MAG: Rho termination factor N-terminal domain-containing protein, partial [Burkholderiales bacterium]